MSIPDIEPARLPALVYLHGSQTSIVDRVDFKLIERRDRAILRALLAYTLDELDRFEAREMPPSLLPGTPRPGSNP